MMMKNGKKSPFEDAFFKNLVVAAEENNYIAPEVYVKYNTKRGLRNEDGTGVLIGVTEIGEVLGYAKDGDIKTPTDGELYYRGVNIADLAEGLIREDRMGYGEICYLLLFGSLPKKNELMIFREMLATLRYLPDGFNEDMILKAPSKNVMNKLARSVLTSYSYDDNPDDTSIENILRQSIELIARFPTMVAYAYQAKVHFYDNKSLFIHLPKEGLSTAECFLHMLRTDHAYSKLEAQTLDLSLILHAEHGGGNNSSFVTRVVSSTDTDTYSAIGAAIGSLKGSKHGGANIRVVEMIEDLKRNVKDVTDERQIEAYMEKLLNKEAFDRSGLIYGMGHAVYTISDPRARVLKKKAQELAEEKGLLVDYNICSMIEKLTPAVLSNKLNRPINVPANVDLYSGLVYQMLNIPKELFTPIFAMGRIPGWCAHRIEEVISGGKIIRPAYQNVCPRQTYVPLSLRG